MFTFQQLIDRQTATGHWSVTTVVSNGLRLDHGSHGRVAEKEKAEELKSIDVTNTNVTSRLKYEDS